MNKDTLIKFKKRAQKLKEDRADIRYITIIDFLNRKGLLISKEKLKETKAVKIKINEAFWAGKHVEPRILEVLPAAIIHFPKAFDGHKEMPNELSDVLTNIKGRELDGPDLCGIKYKKILQWTNLQLRDRRTKPQNKKKISKIFRLSPSIINKIEKLSTINECTQTELIEKLIHEA